MTSTKPKFPSIPKDERSPLVDALLEFINWQALRIEDLEDEIQKLKQETRRPKIKPSKMDENTDDGDDPKKKPAKKRKKTASLKIDEERVIQPKNIPEDARFKGYRDIIVQDIVIRPHNTRYRLAQYETADGKNLSGKLPAEIRDGHWGNTLHSFILYQYHHQHVTQPLLLEQLHDMGVEISSGKLSDLLTEGLDSFHEEKDELLRVALACSPYIQTDDTGARHGGKNGYCTHIGNELFAWFESTESKSRINFLELLSQGVEKRYVLNAGAFEYMERQKLPKSVLSGLEFQSADIGNEDQWNDWLSDLGITGVRHKKICTEAALIGGLLEQGIPADLGVISDDAGQFNVFDHALCWIHSERLVNRLIPVNDKQKEAVKQARDQIWTLYADLKVYKKSPEQESAERIKNDFEKLCRTRTDYETLNQVLKRMGQNQHELLRVLDRPEIPLHNNLSERDIRDYVKKRKISGGTRSENGRRCRDTFAGLKKTCRKHGVSFWNYLLDRTSGVGKLPSMAELIQTAARGL
ncbi:MAG: transposase [Gammaproteobacteria bacterium]|nr:transposase [Gammaproteobacteria bacterium]